MMSWRMSEMLNLERGQCYYFLLKCVVSQIQMRESKPHEARRELSGDQARSATSIEEDGIGGG